MEFAENTPQAGKILGEIAVDLTKAARAIFLPVQGLVWTAEKFEHEFLLLLAKKVTKTSPDWGLLPIPTKR